uniref:Vomeronasal type-2 receptor 26-like n=1 Tax=Pogona vitticeps TaxID=103695 RepID=A0A6J0SAP0_9SAUR
MMLKASQDNLVQCKVYYPPSSPHKYHQPGRLFLGFLVSQTIIVSSETAFTKEPKLSLIEELAVLTKNYQHILALEFAIKEVNEDPQILPNFTLGFQIYDSYFSAKWTFYSTMQFISLSERFVPNYRCNLQNTLSGVIGGLDPQISLYMATILDLYKIPQLIYGCAPVMNNKTPGLFFYQMAPKETIQNTGILSLLLHFGWVWIGVLTVDDDNGERFVDNVLPIFYERGICFAFIETAPRINLVTDVKYELERGARIYNKIMGSNANALVVYGESYFMVSLRWLPYVSELEQVTTTLKGKVWIMTAEIEFVSLAFQRTWKSGMFHGAIAFTTHSDDLSEFPQFVENKKPSNNKQDGFMRDFWQHAFDCLFPETVLHESDDKICTEEEKLDSLPEAFFEMRMTGHSYSIYNAVYTVAYALHAMSLSRLGPRAVVDGRGLKFLQQDLWVLHHYLRSVSFNNSAGDEVSFDQNGELVAGFDVVNWVISSNQSFARVKVGTLDPKAVGDQAFTINENAIVWNTWFNEVQPISRCQDICYRGYRKKMKEGEPFCCYDCISCPEGKVSDQEDMNDCYQCRDEYYPNIKQDLCIPRSISYLSYQEPLGISLSFSAVSLCLITALVLGIFIKHHTTPIVKANNQDLSYTLLISLLFCFLCTFLFIGQPQKMMCLLRQPAFGIVFSVAVSCVLAKTITVVLAFMATEPGSRIRKWVGKRLANSIIFFCSLIQAGICTVWLVFFPPFPNADMHFIPEAIVLECNERSPVMFYCVLGYMGFLALASFTVAFLARNLPDSFNEAKFISFSMLVFCSVWISFIPTYLSTKGKNMAATEIFAILVSSTGLLSFNFFPKCFIILFRPELNRKEHVLRGNL